MGTNKGQVTTGKNRETGAAMQHTKSERAKRSAMDRSHGSAVERVATRIRKKINGTRAIQGMERQRGFERDTL